MNAITGVHPASDAHTPILFLPGLLCDDRLWRDQVEALRDVVTPYVADLTLDDRRRRRSCEGGSPDD